MRGARGGRHRDRHEVPPRPGAEEPDGEHTSEQRAEPGHSARGGYLGGAYPASPPPADAPVTGPDAESADPYYRRPDYRTDPDGIALPELTERSVESPD